MLPNRGLKDRDNFRFRMKDNLTPLGKKLFESGWELADLLSMGYGAELPVTATDTAITTDSVTSQFPEDIPKQMRACQGKLINVRGGGRNDDQPWLLVQSPAHTPSPFDCCGHAADDQ